MAGERTREGLACGALLRSWDMVRSSRKPRRSYLQRQPTPPRHASVLRMPGNALPKTLPRHQELETNHGPSARRWGPTELSPRNARHPAQQGRESRHSADPVTSQTARQAPRAGASGTGGASVWPGSGVGTDWGGILERGGPGKGPPCWRGRHPGVPVHKAPWPHASGLDVNHFFKPDEASRRGPPGRWPIGPCVTQTAISVGRAGDRHAGRFSWGFSVAQQRRPRAREPWKDGQPGRICRLS